MDNILDLRDEILLNNNVGQEDLVTVLENSNKNIKELNLNISIDGDLDFSVIKTMNFGLIDTIKLSRGNITSIKNLPDKLKELHIEGNLIFEITDLPVSLEVIHIHNNFLKTLEIANLKKLKELHLDNNRIEVLKDFSDTLEELSLTYNKIPSLQLHGLSKLMLLNVSENPIHLIEGIPENIVDFKHENTPSIEFRNYAADLQGFVNEEEIEQKKKEKELQKNYEEALHTYFELKAKYQKKQYELKKKAYAAQNTKKAKRNAVNSVVAPCIKCKRNVGTLFYKENNNYIAICGDKKQPCDLNIKLFDGETSLMEEYLEIGIEDFNESKENIIKHKLDTIFNYIDESESSEIYKTFLEEYNLLNKYMHDLKRNFDNIYFNDIRDDTIADKNKKIFGYIQDIQIILNEYKENHNEELIKEAVKVHIENIIPELRNIRILQNEINEMEIDPETKISKVFKFPVALNKLEQINSLPRVESFIY